MSAIRALFIKPAETANQLSAKQLFDITCAGRNDSSIRVERGAHGKGQKIHVKDKGRL